MTLRLGGGQAGYGDTTEPVQDLLEAGIDYLVCDALAESTLAVLQKDRQRDPRLGFTRDLPDYVETALPWLTSRATKLITNAGGLNPMQAGNVVVDTLQRAGATGVRVAIVLGDDLTQSGIDLTAAADADIDPVFVNVYLGARPVVEALDRGADIVITGRVADASLFVGPMVHTFGWAWDDWDRLGCGVTVGHLLECGAMVTGAVYSGDWWLVPDPETPGYPIAELEADGTAVITKPSKTGGRVSFDTVREQLLYEVHDPSAYLNPDCSVDFTSVRLTDLGDDRVEVAHVRGAAPPPTYKALVCSPAGYMGDKTFGFSWPDAEAKARAAVARLKARTEHRGVEVLEWCEELFGAGAFHGDAAADDLARARAAGWEPPEVVVRVAWRCATVVDARAVGAGFIGMMPPMTSPIGRPKYREPTQLLSIRGFPVDRALVDPLVSVHMMES